MKKAFDQTVRDIKREVNKKVLKVPSIEQKVLDATSNEPWGPHGSHLADIAHATRNYNEYQMIMAVLWKRINDTGKNWRHVYKALTVLEYLVAHGSERVIDEIREHAYQISTLSDFQYIDSSGRDQGNNVRKKSQSLVTLVNDKERIEEARLKAAANRDKFRGPSSTGGMYRPGGGYGDRYDDDRYGYRDDDRNGYGRERDWGGRDDDRYGRGGDSYGRDRYNRESDDRFGRDGYRDDDYRGDRNNDDYRYGPRSRSSEREKDRSYEDDDPYSSRSGTGRADDHSPDERRVERKLSEVNMSAPPAYEEVIADSQSQAIDGRDGRNVAAAPKGSSPSPGNTSQPQPASTVNVAASSPIKEEDAFDEFDPRAPASDFVPFPAAAPTACSTGEVDLFGALSDSNTLALVPVTSETTTSQLNDSPVTSSFGASFVPLSSASTVLNQPAENPFGDAPFKAVPSEDSFTPQPQGFVATSPFQQQPVVSESSIPPQPSGLMIEPVSNFEFADTFPGVTFAPMSAPNAQFPVTTSDYSSQVPSAADPSNDILHGILPQSGPAAGPVPSQSAFSAPATTPLTSQGAFPAPAAAPLASQAAFPAPTATPLTSQAAFPAPVATQLTSQASFSAPAATLLTSQPGFSAPAATPVPSQAALSATASPSAFQAAMPGNGANSVASQSITPGSANGAVASHMGFASVPAASHAPVSGFTTVPLASQAPVPGLAAMPIASQANLMVPTATSIASQAAGPAPVRTHPGPAALPVASQASFLDVTGTTARSQPPKDKFETKSNVWSDTLNRGLVNLNISGPKINPLADIGIDFDSINRMEKRKEKSSAASLTSTVTMGKAMGSGSGIGRAGASGLAAPPNHMMGSGMGMGMGMGMGAGAGMGMGMGMGGYGGMNRPMGALGGMNQPMGAPGGMNQPMGMNMGMNVGMAQGAVQMRPAAGLPQAGSGMPVGYNPMMGTGGYTSQQPYGGYR